MVTSLFEERALVRGAAARTDAVGRPSSSPISSGSASATTTSWNDWGRRRPSLNRVIFDGFSHQLPDIDPEEPGSGSTRFDAVVETRGKSRARFLLMKLLERARELQVGFPATVSTPYINTIPPEQRAVVPRRRAHRAPHPGLHPLERGGDGHPGQHALRGHRRPPGHLRLLGRRSTRSASTTSSAARTTALAGDQVFFQGHAAPGIYARAFLEGRLDRGPARPLPPGGRRRRPVDATPTPG